MQYYDRYLTVGLLLILLVGGIIFAARDHNLVLSSPSAVRTIIKQVSSPNCTLARGFASRFRYHDRWLDCPPLAAKTMNRAPSRR
ncbi:MAG TPA: hypothetical protein VK357_14875 [Rubrobacteraceae bacterium]|jgi:hypothetical protein|nr:hypothetical protein [Rubrobacteraceae bacterium]